jgi:hypothetical protein
MFAHGCIFHPQITPFSHGLSIEFGSSLLAGSPVLGGLMSFFWKLERGLSEQPGSAAESDLSTGTRSIRLRGLRACGKIEDVTFRLVETREKIRAARDLVNNRYLWRGYGGNHRILSDAYHATFTAEANGEVVGTITLATDSRNGLAIDRAFRNELDRYRARPGVRICELTKFAFNPKIQSREIMAALFHIVFVYGYRSHGCTDLFIEVNPRHVRFYEVMLGFERIGDLRENESVRAPAQLMWLKVAKIREQINAVAGKAGHANQRALYRLFLSPTEESRIYERLTATEGSGPVCEQRAQGLAALTGQRAPTRCFGTAEQAQRPGSNFADSVCYA